MNKSEVEDHWNQTEAKEMAVEFFRHVHNFKKHPMDQKIKDISHGEMSVIAFLTHIQENIAAGELSKCLNISTPRIAAILKSLERKGYIKRQVDELDKRKVIVSTTKKGKEYGLEREREAVGDLTNLFKKLGPDDGKELLRIIRRVEQIFKEK